MTRAQALLYMSCPKRNSMRDETTLSPFLSTKKVSSYLTNQAPSLGHSVLQDISRILRRDCPSQQRLRKAFETVKNVEDVLWPLDGEEDPKVAEAKWSKHDATSSNGYNCYSTSRTSSLHATGNRLTNAVTTSYPTSVGSASTMQNRSSNTLTSQTAGFVTAGMYHLKSETEKGEKRSRSIKDVDIARYGEACQRKHQKVAEGQESLMTMWGRNSITSLSSSGASSSLDIPISLKQNKLLPRMTKDTQDSSSMPRSSRPKPTLPFILPDEELKTESRKPLSPIPQQLMGHTLRPIVNAKHRRPLREFQNDLHKPYVFLSSSPLPEESALKEIQRKTPLTCPASNKENENEGSSKLSDTRPSSTYHHTSVVQAQANNAITRKTLGVRRSMVGWTARGHHSNPYSESGA